jgi:signal peptide peptidase SppA
MDDLQSKGTISAFEAIGLGLIDETGYLQDYVLKSSGTLGESEMCLEQCSGLEKDEEDHLREGAMLENVFGKTHANHEKLESTFEKVAANKFEIISKRTVEKYPAAEEMKGSTIFHEKNVPPVWDVKNYLKKIEWTKIEEKSRKKGYVAIIHAEGQISSGKKSTGSGIYSESLSGVLEKALSDKNVKGVVLRIDSPGGDPVACDTITRSVQRLQAANKPVVAHMSSVAASGGYWIGSQCNSITAAPLTVTGSIGVIAGSVSFGSMLDRYGITKDSYTTHESSTPAMPFYDGLNDSQLNILSRTIDHMYDHFVKRVSVCRGLDEEKALAVAKGRVWLGSEAKTRNLVDNANESECSPMCSVEMASNLVIGEDNKLIGVVYPPPPKTFMEAIAMATSKQKRGQGVPFSAAADEAMTVFETPLQRLAMTGGRGTSASEYQRLKLVCDVDTVEIDFVQKARDVLSRFLLSSS